MTLPELFSLVEILDARSKQIDSKLQALILLMADLRRAVDAQDQQNTATRDLIDDRLMKLLNTQTSIGNKLRREIADLPPIAKKVNTQNPNHQK